MTIDGITVDSKEFWNNDGLDVGDCKHVRITNCFVDATDDGICLKSHDPNAICEDIEIRNCVVRSSASGIKFGTMSLGGYKDIRIINNKVYDTFVEGSKESFDLIFTMFPCMLAMIFGLNIFIKSGILNYLFDILKSISIIAINS